MNPGVFCFMSMVILSILYATGWGDRYLPSGKPKTVSVLLILFAIGILGAFDISFQSISVNFGSLILVVLIGLYLASLQKTSDRIQFLCAMITSAACSIVFMTLVPRDPAFYLLKDRYLYPTVSVLCAYLFSREPLFCLTTSVAGILLAGVVNENRSPAATDTVYLGVADLMDLISTAALIAFLADRIVSVIGYLFSKFNRGGERNLGGDPT